MARKPITVSMVMGERTARICGVSDYSEHLCNALQAVGGVTPHLHAVNAETGRADLMAVRRTVRAIRRDHPDVVHMQLPSVAYNGRVAPFLIPALLRWRSRPRIVLTFHESTNPTRLWELRYGMALMAADAVIRVASTVQLASWHQTLAARKPHEVVPIASTVRLTKDAGVTPDVRELFSEPVSRVFTSFGLVIREKRIEEMLDWIARDTQTGFLIVGGHRPDDPYPSEIARRIQHLGLSSRALMTGWSSEDQVAKFLRITDAVIVPVVRPNSGAYTAALQHGIPVISLEPPGPSDPTRGVIVLDSLKDRPLDDALRTARADMKGAPSVVTWESIAEAHVRLYQSLMASSQTRN